MHRPEGASGHRQSMSDPHRNSDVDRGFDPGDDDDLVAGPYRQMAGVLALPGELLHGRNGQLHEVLLPRPVQAELKELVRQHEAIGLGKPVHEPPLFQNGQHPEDLAVRLADPRGDRRQVLALVPAGQVLDDVEPLFQGRGGVLRLPTHAGSRPSRLEESRSSCESPAGRPDVFRPRRLMPRRVARSRRRGGARSGGTSPVPVEPDGSRAASPDGLSAPGALPAKGLTMPFRAYHL